MFEFGDAFAFDDCGAAYPAISSAVGPVYTPVNQDGNPANSDGGGYGGCYWKPSQDARAGPHHEAAWLNRGSGWGSWTLPRPYSWWGVPQNMDASTPLDASQIPGLTPASFMFAFRAWSTAEDRRFSLVGKPEPEPEPRRVGSTRSGKQRANKRKRGS